MGVSFTSLGVIHQIEPDVLLHLAWRGSGSEAKSPKTLVEKRSLFHHPFFPYKFAPMKSCEKICTKGFTSARTTTIFGSKK